MCVCVFQTSTGSLENKKHRKNSDRFSMIKIYIDEYNFRTKRKDFSFANESLQKLYKITQGINFTTFKVLPLLHLIHAALKSRNIACLFADDNNVAQSFSN